MGSRLRNKDPRSGKLDTSHFKNCGSEGIGDFSMDEVKFPKDTLPMQLINEVFSQVPVNHKDSWRLNSTYYDPFFCYQWEEKDDIFLFNIVGRNESCCNFMYLCLADQKGILRDIYYMGIWGGDAGWSQNDTGERLGFGNYHLIKDCKDCGDEFDGKKYVGSKCITFYTEVELSIDDYQFVIDTLEFVKSDTLILFDE